MAKLKKTSAGTDVLTAARERFATLFDRFDHVSVSFSGGKDSTVCLHLALEAARERGRLPLDVLFWDEEAIHDQTIEYVERVRAMPEVRLRWLCVPIRHRNACSRQQPYWYPWAEEDRALWCRPLPEGAERSIPGFSRGMTMPESAPRAFPRDVGTWADVRGLRADESVRRYGAVSKRMKDNWIGGPSKHWWPVSPIYDWTTVDVWTAPKLFGWDYNKTYDLLLMAGVSPSQQRVCPPFGEEPLERLPLYAVCWPELWSKMVGRVHGAATAARYAQSELYAFGEQRKPKGMTWRDWTFALLDLYPPDLRETIAGNINRLIADQAEKAKRSIPETEPDPLTGLSWKFLAMIANRGDLKGRKRQMLGAKADVVRKRLGVTYEDMLAEADNDGTRY